METYISEKVHPEAASTANVWRMYWETTANEQCMQFIGLILICYNIMAEFDSNALPPFYLKSTT